MMFNGGNVKLIKGGEEPVYLPADADVPYNRIVFTKDYFSSALHEIAHWCIAGEARRKQIDFGYWYLPDGRNSQQQITFEQAEVKSQALEWVFSEYSRQKFNVSADNLSGGERHFPENFARQVYEQVLHYCEGGLPARAETFRCSLAQTFGHPTELCSALFKFDQLKMSSNE